MSLNNLITPLARVKGLGSAKTGTEHFWMQRLTAVALAPLCIWFCFSLATMAQMSYANFTAWLQSPIQAVLMITMIIAMFYHAMLGIQVVLEDYVSSHGARSASIVAVQFICIFAAVSGVLSVIKIAVGSAA